MPWFRVTWAFGDRSSSFLLEADSRKHAEQAFGACRIHGISLVTIEPTDDDGDAASAATLPTSPQPRSPTAVAELPIGDEPE